MGSRSYCFTIFDLGIVPKLGGDIRYVVWQVEMCPETLSLHYQGYAELTKSKGNGYLLKQWGGKFHTEKRHGTRDQARDYCMKEDTGCCGPWELGEWIRGQGARNDIQNVYNSLKEDKKYITILDEDAPTLIRYHRGFQWAKGLIDKHKSKMFRQVQVIVLYGDAGAGKTRAAIEESGNDYYILDQLDSDKVWFDGYEGESTLIIDDFYGWIKYGYLLRLLDGHQVRLNIKGSSGYALWTKVIITSNKHPEQWYSQGLTDALARRFSDVRKLTLHEVPGG